jgi:regulatory protein
VSDIRGKLIKELDGKTDEVDVALRQLIEDRYVDDNRYAVAFARDKAAIAGWGRTKIKYMLSAKGIARDVIDASLSEVDDTKAAGRLERLLKNKYKTLKSDPQWKMKILRFALGRGYSYDEVNKALMNVNKSESVGYEEI